MRFGNSGGNNKGKKYLDRDNLNYDRLTGNDYARLDDFNTWYTDNIEALEQDLKTKGCYDADISNDTYTKTCESILFSKIEIEDYKSYFSRAYFTNMVQSKMKERRYVLPDERLLANHIHIIQDSWNDEHDAEKKLLIKDVCDFVRKYHNEREANLFMQYMNLEVRKYKILSELTGIKIYIIQRIISNIKVNIQSNMELTNRRKQIQ